MNAAKRIAFATVLVLLLAAGAVWLTSGRGSRPAPEPPGDRPVSAAEPNGPPPSGVAGPESPVAPPSPTEEPATPARSVVVRGVVLDARDRRPVAGAEIRLAPGGSVEGWSEARAGGPLGETATGPDGTFAFEKVPAEGLVTAEVRAAGYAPARESVDLRENARPPAPIRFELERAGTVRGTVTGPDGAPVAGAVIYAIPGDAPAMLFRHPDQLVSGTGGSWQSLVGETREDGRYEISGLPPGAVFVLRASAEGHAPSIDHPGIRATEEVPDVLVDLALRKAAGLTIRVVDPDGEPVEAVIAILTYEDSPVFLEPDEPGLFRIVDLSPGTHPLEVRPSGYLTETFDLELIEGEQRGLTVRADPGCALSGVLLDGEGKPVAGARVFTSRPRRLADEGPQSSGQCVTDEQGKFRITGLRPGPYLLSYYAPPCEPVMNGPFTAPADGLRLVAAEYATVRVRLRLPAGAEAPKDVTVYHSGRAYDPEVWFDESRGISARRVPWNEGGIAVDRLPGGPVRFFLRAGDFAPVRMTLDLASGEERDLGEIALSRGLVLAGRVEDPAGLPVSGADVSAGFLSLHPMVWAVTGDDGGFELPGLDAETWWVAVEAEGFLAARQEVVASPGRGVHVLTVFRGGLLRGRTVDGEGNPLTGLDLHVFDPADKDADGRFDYVSTDARGTFTTRLLAGMYRIEVWRGRERIRTAAASLMEGATTDCEIRLGD